MSKALATYKPTTHSFSSLKTFATCPYQYQQVNILKKWKPKPFDAADYGARAHKAFEDYITKGVPLPDEFMPYDGLMKTVDAFNGQKRAEYRMGLKADASACGFFDDGVVIRGSADLVAVWKDSALVVDWKSGKSTRPDSDQLHLMALMVFAHYPQVTRVQGMLHFFIEDCVHTQVYERSKVPAMWAYWQEKMQAEDAAKRSGVFAMYPGGLCKGWCAVESCINWEAGAAKRLAV